jgi:hypothetical protein
VIVTSDQFRLLLAAIRKLLPRFEVRPRHSYLHQT